MVNFCPKRYDLNPLLCHGPYDDGGGYVANTIAPFSALNLYQAQPVGGVVRKPAPINAPTQANTPPSINRLQEFSGQDDFMAEQRIQRKISDNIVMARANASSVKVGIFTAGQNADQRMQNLLQAQYLPEQASNNMAQFAPASAQAKLNLYKNLGADQKTLSNPIYDLLKA